MKSFFLALIVVLSSIAFAPAAEAKEAPTLYCATTRETLQLRDGMSRREVSAIIFDGEKEVVIGLGTARSGGMYINWPRCSAPEVADQLLTVHFKLSTTPGQFWDLYAWS